MDIGDKGRIKKFDPQGQFLSKIETFNPQDDKFISPQYRFALDNE
jgi:hypothetical protein